MKSFEASLIFSTVGLGIEADNIFLVNDEIVSGEDEGRRVERCRREVLKSTRWVWRCVRKSEIISRLSAFVNVLSPNRCLSAYHLTQESN